MTSRDRTHPGGKSAAELEREVEAQRSEVEDDLDRLQERLSPGQLMDQVFDYARNGNGAEFTCNLRRNMRDNPIPVALMGIGMAWLMAGGGSGDNRRSRWSRFDDHDDDDRFERGWDPDWDDDRWDDRFSSDEDDIAGDPVAFGMTPQARNCDAPGHDRPSGDKDDKGMTAKAGEAAGDVKDRLSAAGARMSDGMRSSRDAAARHGRNIRRSARQYRDDVGRRANRYGRRARRGFLNTLEEQPLVLGAIGVTIGAALGAALPPSQREDELMGETRDELKNQAVREGRRQKEKARDMADAAYSAAKDEADRQGLTTDDGKTAADKLKDKSAKVASAAKSAAEKERSMS